MRKYGVAQIREFFGRVDRELTEPTTIVVIGGGAIALKYQGTHATTDLDLWTRGEPSFWNAVERVKTVAPGASLPVHIATLATPPIDFEDRLIALDTPSLEKLTVLVPEAHDLVLLKVARAEAHDLDAIEDIHRAQPLDLDVLIARYRETRPQVIGDVEQHRLNFLAAVARLFGEAKAEEVDELTGRVR